MKLSFWYKSQVVSGCHLVADKLLRGHCWGFNNKKWRRSNYGRVTLRQSLQGLSVFGLGKATLCWSKQLSKELGTLASAVDKVTLSSNGESPLERDNLALQYQCLGSLATGSSNKELFFSLAAGSQLMIG